MPLQDYEPLPLSCFTRMQPSCFFKSSPDITPYKPQPANNSAITYGKHKSTERIALSQMAKIHLLVMANKI